MSDGVISIIADDGPQFWNLFKCQSGSYIPSESNLSIGDKTIDFK